MLQVVFLPRTRAWAMRCSCSA